MILSRGRAKLCLDIGRVYGVNRVSGASQFKRWNSGHEKIESGVSTTESERNENTTSPTTAPTRSPTRGKKLPPPPQDYIILGAKSSRLTPKYKPPKPFNKHVKVDDLDEQRKQLLVFTSDVSMDTALANIDRMKPPILTLSPKRFDQLLIDLKRSFAISQLKEYIRSKSTTAKYSGNKSQLINTILKTLWRTSVSNSVNESSDVIIERTFQLTRRELFIIVSQNSKLPRSWTKSGASIVILGDEQKIIVRATADTCNWIMASLHKTLQSIQDVDIDFGCLEPFASIDNIPLGQIQRLSDTYLRYQKSDKSLVASSKSIDHVNHARRLILYSTGFMPRQSSNYIYSGDVGMESLSRIIDDDALAWNERSKVWKRIKKVRSKHEFSSFQGSRELSSYKQNISIASEGASRTESNTSFEEVITSQILPSPPPNNQLTFTATFGYLLHDFSSNESSPLNTHKTFLSNSPFIFQRCSELPLYHLETNHDSGIVPPKPSPSSAEESNDAWSRLISNAKLLSDAIPDAETSDIVATNESESILEDDSMRLIQIKFTPSPFHTKDLKKLQHLPPIEMWFEFKDNSDECDFESIRLVCSEREINSYLSLPNFETDVKFSSTSSRFLNHEQDGIKQFIYRAHLSISGNNRIHVPNELKIKLDDNEDSEEVTYLYQSMCYRRQIDLSFKGHILQLTSLESGGFGGRRIEANLVLDYPDGQKAEQTDIKAFIRDGLEFCQSLRRQSIHL